MKTNFSRRRFLGTASAAVGLLGGASPGAAAEPQDCKIPNPAQAKPFTPSTQPIQPRKPASTLTAAEVAKLRQAYKALRALPATDPIGWQQQANKHCYQCGGGLDGIAGEEIHGSWLFFPWHRAFLYYHERILQKLAGDPNLRLAYWDWDNAANRAVPPAWLTPADSSNSLWDQNRSAKAGDQVPLNVVGPQPMNSIWTAPDFATFGGVSSNGQDGGIVENTVHGAVHIWCGDTTMKSGKPDMGLLDTAAQDPIFFAHHSNIDRIWSVWGKSSTKHTNPPDQAWREHKFYFFDENRNWVSIAVKDVLDEAQSLRYQYSAATPQQITDLGSLSTSAVAFSADRVLTLPSAAMAQPTQKFAAIRVEGIQLPQGSKGVFRVIAKRPGGGAGSDVGFLAIVPKTSQSVHEHGGFSTTLNLTGRLQELAGRQGKLQLSLAPVGSENVNGIPLKFSAVSLLRGD